MKSPSQDRVQAFLNRNQQHISSTKELNLLNLKNTSNTNSSKSQSDTRTRTDASKEKQTPSPIHPRELSHINSDFRGNSDSFLSNDKDLQPFISSKSNNGNLLSEIDYLYNYATNTNTSIKSPIKISTNYEKENNSREQEYNSAPRSPFKKETTIEYKSNSEFLKPSSPIASPKANPEILTSKLEAYLISKKKFQEKLKENLNKDLAKSASKSQLASKSPKNIETSASTRSLKKPKSLIDVSPVSQYSSNYASKSNKFATNEDRVESPNFQRVSTSQYNSKSRNETTPSEPKTPVSPKKITRTPQRISEASKSKKVSSPKVSPPKSSDETPTPTRKREKSAKMKIPEKEMIFMYSSRKLGEIDANLDQDSKYKNEIKNLIKTIKEEKEQVSNDLLKMAAQLSKYKSKYKKLKKNVKDKNDSEDKSEEKIDEVKKRPDSITVFTVDDLKPPERIRTPKKDSNATRGEDLLRKIETLNKDVESIMSGVKREFRSKSESENFELPKTPEIAFILKEMGLDFGVFFTDSTTLEKNPSKPDQRDLNLANKKIIQFLYDKLLYEQYQRLKTEEQANEMISSMQITINQLEEKRIPIRK